MEKLGVLKLWMVKNIWFLKTTLINSASPLVSMRTLRKILCLLLAKKALAGYELQIYKQIIRLC